MKKKFVFILTAMMLCLVFALSACGETGGGNHGGTNGSNNGNTNHDDGTYYTVTFDSQGGSNVESQRVLAGNPVRTPSTPTNGELLFQGWFASSDAGAEAWNFETGRVNGDMTLFAHWAADTSEPTASITYEKTADNTGYIVTGAGQEAKIVIPETYDNLPVVEIGESAFAYSKHKSDIISVTIPDNVTKIGLNAFNNQGALETVNIGTNSKLVSIENNAFSGNGALKGFYLPAGAIELGDSVFNNCGSLNSFTVASGNTAYSGEGNNLIDRASNTVIRGTNNSVIPETVTKIGVAAFRRAQMTALTVPASVTVIEKYAFSDSSIVAINYRGTQEAWDKAVRDENGKERMWKSSRQDIAVHCADTAETSNILVAYFSATGTTKGVAEKIAAATGGTLYEIVSKVPYTAADLDYSDSTTRATAEQHDPAARPAIDGTVENMASYDVVFLGYPIWWGKAPKIVYTFLETYEFAGKSIVPFCTSGSSGIGGSLSDLRALATDATWLSGERFAGTVAQSVIQTWVNGLTY